MARPTLLLAVLPAALLAVGGCLPVGPPRSVDPPRPSTEAPSPGDDGWTSLFDGVSTSGLRAYGALDGPTGLPPGRWEIADGSLRTIPGTGTDLITDASFEDFELAFSWAVSPGGNSGVMIAVHESAAPSWATGPEYQLLDDAGHPDGADPRTSTAALYGLLGPDPERRLAPVGAWNDARIVVLDGHVEHWLNGRLVLAYDWDDPELRAGIQTSKFAGLEGFMGERRGRIAFQHHGEQASFGPIRIRPLD